MPAHEYEDADEVYQMMEQERMTEELEAERAKLDLERFWSRSKLNDLGMCPSERTRRTLPSSTSSHSYKSDRDLSQSDCHQFCTDDQYNDNDAVKRNLSLPFGSLHSQDDGRALRKSSLYPKPGLESSSFHTATTAACSVFDMTSTNHSSSTIATMASHHEFYAPPHPQNFHRIQAFDRTPYATTRRDLEKEEPFRRHPSTSRQSERELPQLSPCQETKPSSRSSYGTSMPDFGQIPQQPPSRPRASDNFRIPYNDTDCLDESSHNDNLSTPPSPDHESIPDDFVSRSVPSSTFPATMDNRSTAPAQLRRYQYRQTRKQEEANTTLKRIPTPTLSSHKSNDNHYKIDDPSPPPQQHQEQDCTRLVVPRRLPPRQHSRGEGAVQPPTTRTTPTTPNTIDIGQGQQITLRGDEETKAAIVNDFYVPKVCFGCSLDLFCIQDVQYFLCPVCKVVNPMQDNASGIEKECPREACTGFTLERLFELQAHIIEAEGYNK